MAFPKIDACLICEGVRPEAFGKHILLGFFGAAPHARVSIKNIAHPTILCFVFCGGAGEGNFNIDLRVTDSNGTVVANPTPGLVNAQLLSGKSSTVIFMSFNGTFSNYGVFRVALVINGTEHYSTTVAIDPFTTPPIN